MSPSGGRVACLGCAGIARQAFPRCCSVESAPDGSPGDTCVGKDIAAGKFKAYANTGGIVVDSTPKGKWLGMIPSLGVNPSTSGRCSSYQPRYLPLSPLLLCDGTVSIPGLTAPLVANASGHAQTACRCCFRSTARSEAPCVAWRHAAPVALAGATASPP